MVDRQMQPVEVRHGLLEPPERFAQLPIDLLVAGNIRMVVRRCTDGLVLLTQFLQQASVLSHTRSRAAGLRQTLKYRCSFRAPCHERLTDMHRASHYRRSPCPRPSAISAG